ncbi:MAG: alpha/beta hydrolase [Erysipelotrichales bacterium]|nr:alpha/beta hydrolase [Erysipelotrichales bacterium]
MKKILLLHGWNYKNYTKLTEEKDAWHNRKKFVSELEKNYEVYKLNFPGFCSEKEPKKSWNLSDFAKYVHDYLETNNLKVDYVLGYSFGGAVAVTYNRLYDSKQKLILISPAIVRNYDKSKKFIKTPAFLTPIRNLIRNSYLINIVKTNEMVYGTKFLRDTYQSIVRIELIDEIEKIDPNRLKIIYGTEDKMVNPRLVESKVLDKYKKCIYFIEGGGHDIANTHTKELIDIIGK